LKKIIKVGNSDSGRPIRDGHESRLLGWTTGHFLQREYRYFRLVFFSPDSPDPKWIEFMKTNIKLLIFLFGLFECSDWELGLTELVEVKSIKNNSQVWTGWTKADFLVILGSEPFISHTTIGNHLPRVIGDVENYTIFNLVGTRTHDQMLDRLVTKITNDKSFQMANMFNRLEGPYSLPTKPQRLAIYGTSNPVIRLIRHQETYN